MSATALPPIGASPPPAPPAAGPGGAAGTPVAAAGPQPSAVAAPQAPLPPPPQPLPGPQAALAAAVEAAAASQGGLAGLLADLAQALASPALPAPVQAAAAQVLGGLTPVDPPPDAAALRQAMSQSGLFLEAALAAGQPAASDLKAALLSLGQALEPWSGPPAAAAPAAPPPPPPTAGAVLTAQAAAASGLAADAAPEVVARRLGRQTAAALSRLTLLQAASTPAGRRGAPDADEPGWLFEIPLATPQGAAVAQFEIGREPARPAAGETPQPTWRVRFCLDLAPMGAVHARIVLGGTGARVSLWAESGATAEALQARRQALVEAMDEADLTAQVAVFHGAPAAPPPAAGRLMDRAL